MEAFIIGSCIWLYLAYVLYNLIPCKKERFDQSDSIAYLPVYEIVSVQNPCAVKQSQEISFENNFVNDINKEIKEHMKQVEKKLDLIQEIKEREIKS